MTQNLNGFLSHFHSGSLPLKSYWPPRGPAFSGALTHRTLVPESSHSARCSTWPVLGQTSLLLSPSLGRARGAPSLAATLPSCLGPPPPLWSLVPASATSSVTSHVHAKAQLFFTPLNHTLETEFLGEEEKDSFIALPGKGEHRGLMPSKQRVSTWGK